MIDRIVITLLLLLFTFLTGREPDLASLQALLEVDALGAPAESATVEHPARMLPLAPPLADRELEFSGMAWYGDRLVLLPQYPGRAGNQLFTLDRAQILAFLRGESDEPLTPQPMVLDDAGLPGRLAYFDGYEAIGFAGDRVYVTVEARDWTGWLVVGQVVDGGARIVLDLNSLVQLPGQARLRNMSDETLVVYGDRVATIYEANGANVNPQPVARLFDDYGAPLGVTPFPTVEYRITDATAADESGRFWAINYFWSGDAPKLQPAPDSLAATYGQGRTHANTETVERLVEFQWTDAGVVRTTTPPRQLRLLPGGIARNWEGLATLRDGDIDGFLLVTDRFPSTILAFVER